MQRKWRLEQYYLKGVENEWKELNRIKEIFYILIEDGGYMV